MKKRIGNDIQFTWHIFRKSGDTQTPESFEGKEVEVKLISPLRQPVTIEDVTIAIGVVTFTFRGKHQVTLGNYVAILQENRGEDGMVTLDVVNAVTLVPHSYMEEDGDEGDVIEATSVELDSEIGQGIDAYTKAESDELFVKKIFDEPGVGTTYFSPTGMTSLTFDEHGVMRQTSSYGALGWSLYDGTDYIQTFGGTIYKGGIGTPNSTRVIWEKTATQQIPAATPNTNGLMSAEDKQKITDIEAVIPEQASPSNKLADIDLMNSAIATATALFRGAFNLVTDLHLSVSATHAQIATALATAIQTADNNDYCYVQIPVADATPTEFASVERYKFNGTAWGYEYTLNNSGFTAAQWAALNSGITSGLVTKLSDLPTATELATLLAGKASTSELAEVATSGSYNDLSDKPDLSSFITKSVDNLVNYYLKSETYTKTEVQQLIGAIQQFHYEVYPTLPQTGASNVLYLIGPTGTGTDKYEEYVYANNDFTKIGDTSIDLSGYVTTQALNTALADYVTSSALSTALANYYNKTEVDGLLASKADKNEMSVVPGTGANTDKTTITLKSGTSATVLTTHQDISGKEDVTTIVAPVNATDETLPITTLSCEVGKYYRIDVAVDTLDVTLPAMTDLTAVKTVVICLTAGTTPAVTITAADNKDVYYQDGFEIEAGNIYEINALFNGAAWVVAAVKINVE